MMKATAIPKTLYWERKVMNSFFIPFGGGAGGAGVRSSLILTNCSSIASSFEFVETTCPII